MLGHLLVIGSRTNGAPRPRLAQGWREPRRPRAIVLEALRRFALEHEAVGRPDVAKVAHRALSKLVTYRVAAGVEALDDVDVIEGGD
jgi:hypothetical protein